MAATDPSTIVWFNAVMWGMCFVLGWLIGRYGKRA